MSQTYDWKDFWYEAGKTYIEKAGTNTRPFQIQEKILLDYLSKLDFDSVLELGCGFGRITKLVLETFNPSIYTAVDLSPHQLENARVYIGDDQAHFVNSSIQDFGSTITGYDLVLAVEVLMHVPPNEIREVIDKMTSLSNSHIVNVDWCLTGFRDDPLPYGEGGFIYAHDYKKLYGQKFVGSFPIRDDKDGYNIRQKLFHTQLVD
jgi:SAM-dependent methyltransferase